MDSSYTDGYDFTSSDDGYAQLSNFIKFKKNNYDYKVRVYDENDSSIYKEITFNVGSTNNTPGYSSLAVTASPSDPSKNEWVDITINANVDRPNYDDTVKFTVQKKS